jgi:hypothetical protein
MITFNGIELDYKEDALSGLVIKGGLTKIENLTDRTGTASTQFTLPRTANNELAFGNITTEGAQVQTIGEAYITIEGNIFSKGVLYVTGYDNDNFKCLFMGQDNDLIATLKGKPLKNLMDSNNRFPFTDSNVRFYLENIASVSLGSEVAFHLGSGFFQFLEDGGILDADHVAPFFQVRSMLYKMFKDEGYDLVSNFFDSDYGRSLDYSNFNASDALSDNYFSGASNSLPSSVIVPSSKLSYGELDLGTADVNNNSIALGTSDLPVLGSNAYILVNNCDKINLNGVLNCTFIDEIERIEIVMFVVRPITFDIVYYSNGLPFLNTEELESSNNLKDGINYFNLTFSESFLAGDQINIGYRIFHKNTGSVSLTGANLTCLEMHIGNDNRKPNDSVWIGDYIGKQNQFEFLKGVLKDLNLVMDVDGDNVYIELQDEGVEPIGTSPASLPSIIDNQYDITNIVLNDTTTDIEYIQADLIYLLQNKQEDDYVESRHFFQYQDWGSTYYKLDSFNNNRIEEIKGYFKAYYDGSSFEASSAYALLPPVGYEEWENNLSSRFKYGDGFDGTTTYTYTNVDTTTTTVDALNNWSLPVTFVKTAPTLFINTLNQKKNNKIIEVTFKDELGTIVSNRREYIYKDQVYKIVEWSYDIIKRLVKAKLIMK